jgi:hypothetical protein
LCPISHIRTSNSTGWLHLGQGQMSGMSERIRIQPMAEHEYAVDVTEGTTQTRHRVVVPTDLLDDLGLAGADEETVVRESFAFLLDREPATSIYEEFPLDTVASRFPEFADELRTRLAG